jgi:hypothetical protein
MDTRYRGYWRLVLVGLWEKLLTLLFFLAIAGFVLQSLNELKNEDCQDNA